MVEDPDVRPPTSTTPPLPPAFTPGPGLVWTAVEDDDPLVRLVTSARSCEWQVVHPSGRTKCGRPAAVEVHRSGERWWAYCLADGHGYGRWLDHGRIMIWVQRPEAPDG